MSSPLRVLVTGATGYIGSRMVPALLDEGHTVLAATRSEHKIDDYPWGDDVDTRELDMADEASVRAAVDGVDAVIYLVHAMDGDDFVATDRAHAQRMAAACEDAGVQRVVYLSGLVPDGELSDHLRSRQEVEQVLLEGAVPAVVLRAAMVVGAGSTSYELLRRLVERVPLLTPVPRWMRRDIQPLAVEDVAALVVRALRGEPRNSHYDVGGDEVLSYPDLLALFSEVAGLRRVRFLVPGLPTRFVGWACGLISGLDRTEVVSLVDSLRFDMVCREDTIRRDLLEPDFRYTPLRESLRRSLESGGDPGTASRSDVQHGAATDPA